MMKTTVHLGKGEAYIVKKKSKFKPQKTGYCNSPTCLCVVQLDDNNKCLRCFNRVTQKQNFDATRKYFDSFIKCNEIPLSSVMYDDTTVIPIPIHKRTYFVPIRYFIEFENIPKSDDFIEDKDQAYSNFFNHIKTHCYSVIS